MSPTVKYPLRIRVKPGESLRSFMHRLQERNAYEHFNWLIRDVSINNVTTALNSSQLDRLAIVSGVDADILDAAQESNIDRRPVLLGHRVTLAMVERTVSRLCLFCFQEDPYHRLAWDFTPLAICPIHGSPLLRTCPTCGERLHWRRNAIGKCPNRHKLLDKRLEPASYPLADALNGTRAIYDCLNGVKSRQLTSIKVAVDIPLMDLTAMLEILGRLEEPTPITARIGTKERYEAEDYSLGLDRGYHMACQWPDAFHNVLDQLALDFRDPTFLADKNLPWRKRLNIHLTHNSKKPYAATIASELWRYAGKRGISLSPGAFGFTPDNFPSLYICATEARGLARMDLPKLAKVARREGWHGASQILTRKIAWLKRSEFDQWNNGRAEQLSVKGLTYLLGIASRNIEAMRKKGLFGESAATRRVGHEVSGWRLLQSEYDDFVRRVGAVHPETKTSPSEYVTWNSFTKRPESRQVDFASVIAGMLDGRVRVSKIDISQLSTIRFNLPDALALAQSACVTAPHRAIATPMSARTVVRRYRISWHRLMRAIDLKVLEAVSCEFGVTDHWITEGSMQNFLRKFTTAPQLAYDHGKSPNSMAVVLKRLKVPPFQSQRGIHRDHAIYALEEIHRVGLRNILSQARPSAS